MKKIAKRQFLSVLLTVCMLFSMIGSVTFVSAAEETESSEESVLSAEEYQENTQKQESSEANDSSEEEQGEQNDSSEETQTEKNLKITSWSWIDEEEYLIRNEESGMWELALPGTSQELILTAEDLKVFLPAEATVVLEDDTETTLAVEWNLEAFPQEGAYEGDYLLTANFPEGYELAAEQETLQVKLMLGGVVMLDAAPGSSISAGGLTITADDGNAISYGTAAGTEVYTVSNIIHINTPRALTVKGTTTTHTLAIDAGVQANLTFAGVSITNATNSPVNLISNTAAAPTSLHLTLADGSSNTLNPSSGAANAGLHVTYGAKLTIDDSVKNPVAVSGGRLTADCTINGVEAKAGEPGWVMDSKNPGSLTVYSGTSAACIGGNNKENSGNITVNGGNITVNAYTNGGSSSAGAGIGGGDYGGAGCILDGGGITINSGIINATASYHGAGIGAGWHANVAGTGHAGKVPGDITINGGYITSTGKDHGNAFGGACGSGSNIGHGGSSTPHEIKITGGTLLPKSNNNGTQWDVGANGGAVIVTGGSFYPAAYASSSTGYSIQGAQVKSSDGTSLTMVTIDLSTYTYTLEDGTTKSLEAGDYLYSYSVTVDGTPVSPEYGLAMKLDSTKKLYFWLPSSAVGKSVAISNVILQTKDGTRVDTEYPFTLDKVPGAGSGGSGDSGVTKRYVTFSVNEELFGEELQAMLHKRYDGAAFDWDLLNQGIIAQEIKVPQPENGVISDKNELKETAVRLKDADGKATGEGSSAEGFKEAGEYSITVNYSGYANTAGFSNTFWGHQTTLSSTITRADTRVVDVDYQYTYKAGVTTPTSTKDFATITLTANVIPNNVEDIENNRYEEARSCEAPTGQIQFYINGVRVGAPQPLTAVKTDAASFTRMARMMRTAALFSARASENVTDEAANSGYNYSSATLTLDYTRNNYLVPANADGEFIVTAEYLGSGNYTVSDAGAKTREVPEEFPFTTVPGSVITPENTDPDDLTKDDEVPVLDPLDPTYDVVDEGGEQRLVAYYEDSISRNIVKEEEGDEAPPTTMDKAALETMINQRYVLTNPLGRPQTMGTGADEAVVKMKADNIVIRDGEGNEVDAIDLTQKMNYTIEVVHNQDDQFESSVVHTAVVLKINYNLVDVPAALDEGKPIVDVDTDGDGYPDINLDPDKDGEPDVDVDTDGDGKPDTNVDTDEDGKPDVNVDTDDDGKPDINIVDKDGDGKPDNIDPKNPDQDKTPDVNIVDKDGDGKPDDLDDMKPEDKTPDVNIDTDGDGKPDTNVDTDDDGKPDVNVDTDDDGKPDINIVDKDGDGKPDNIDTKDPDQDKTPDVNIVDKDGDGQPDDLDDMKPEDKTPDVNVDTDGDGKPDLNVDTDDDGKPDVNVDTDDDGKPDINIVDKDGDGKPDNIDTKDPDQDKTPDVNIVDKDGDGKPDDLDDMKPEDKTPDVNIDTDGDGKPDVNVDTDDDGKPDVNVDTDDDGKPDINIVDKDGDGKPDNIDTKDPDQDKTPDVNIVDKDGDGKPDDLDDMTPEDKKDLKPDVNVDNDGDGKPDTNVDNDNDGKPDVNVDTDDDGKPDVNIVDKDGDGKPDNINLKDPNQDKTPNVNIVDRDGDGKPDDLDGLTKDQVNNLKPTLNIDTDGDGKADLNIDINGDGKADLNIDTDGDGKADQNIDADGDGKIDNVGPRTGDQGMMPFVMLAVLAVFVMLALVAVKKRLTNQ